MSSDSFSMDAARFEMGVEEDMGGDGIGNEAPRGWKEKRAWEFSKGRFIFQIAGYFLPMTSRDCFSPTVFGLYALELSTFDDARISLMRSSFCRFLAFSTARRSSRSRMMESFSAQQGFGLVDIRGGGAGMGNGVMRVGRLRGLSRERQ